LNPFKTRADRNPSAGTYRTYGVIERANEVQGSDGAITLQWVTLSPAWMNVVPRSGRERFIAGRSVAEGDTSIYTRWRADVTPKMRVNINGAFYNIVAVLNISMENREMELICVTGLNDGE
jgi:SPP1 family predicted phage head-tail adaptor